VSITGLGTNDAETSGHLVKGPGVRQRDDYIAGFFDYMRLTPFMTFIFIFIDQPSVAVVL
jgi:hypothetical protein